MIYYTSASLSLRIKVSQAWDGHPTNFYLLQVVYVRMRDICSLQILAGGAVGAAIALGVQQYWYRREWNASRRQYSALTETEQQPPLSPVQDSSCGLSDFVSDEVLSEQFTRNVQFFGRDGQLKIANAFVVVVGLGVSVHTRSLVTQRHP